MRQQPAGTEPGTVFARQYHDWLTAHHPSLAAGFPAALPVARAAILARLWGALVREPFPDRSTPLTHGESLTLTVGGHTLSGPGSAARPFTTPRPGLAIGGYTDPAALVAGLWPHRLAFAEELANSVTNLALAIAGRAATDPHASTTDIDGDHANPTDVDALVAAEQSIPDGHPLHPCCRTRLGMNAADNLAYAPEHHPAVPLPVIAVPADRWHSTGAGLPPRLPMHPWQWRRLRERYPELRDTGERIPARPLMSLRTLATPRGHLKTSVDLRMTNHVRTVSGAAVSNGPVLSALLSMLLSDLVPKVLAARYGTAAPAHHPPSLAVLAESAAGAVLVDGAPCASLAVIRRAAPALAPGERAIPFAAITGPGPYTARLVDNGYGGDPVAFVGHLATVLLPPLLALLQLGVALDAHGQNLLLVTTPGGRASRVLYRDLGGIRVSQARLAAHGVEAPPMVGDIPTDDTTELRTRVHATAVANVLSHLVTVLADRYHTEPDALWAAVATAVPPDDPLFTLDTLPVKAMTAMRLADSVDDIWAPVANPLAGRR